MKTSVYDKWKLDGWYLYVLSNGTSYYVGISSKPGQRLRDHIRKKRLPGKVWFQFIRPVGFYWRALELEYALQRESKERIWVHMGSQEAFEVFCSSVPEAPMQLRSAHARYIYQRYLREMECITAI